MKVLLLIAAVVSMLAGCSMMPGRDSGRMQDQSAGQIMGTSDMRYEWGRGAYQGPGSMPQWSGGDDTSGGLGWRRD
ncbi:hypothetical protein [Comamonas guangdongensis]|uniref:Lipoprotein n=1 Tax=Comamonas guangdongensis TaxID=510515 RepID=A0ABV3ZVY3_9BURK